MGIPNRACFATNLRDALRCRVCGRAPQSQANYHLGFEYHHIVPQSENGADTPENLVLLCHECHTRHHQKRLTLPDFDQNWDEKFRCHNCDEELDARFVEMNCGWYRCEKCGEKTHLWTHCGFDESESSTRNANF